MLRSFALCLALVVLMGCTEGAKLPQSPNLLRNNPAAGADQWSALPPSRQVNEMEIAYVTDRSPGEASERGVEYTFGRSNGMRYGTTTVAVDAELSWKQLCDYSAGRLAIEAPLLKIRSIRQQGEIKPYLTWMEAKDGQLTVGNSDGLAIETKALENWFAGKMADREGDVYLFVHGAFNIFDDGVIDAAKVWHYLGRRGVPVAYSWPTGRFAGFGSLDYFYDRESSDFTVPHLKRLIRFLGTQPGVQRLHIISHSRGTAVAVSALRELYIEHEAKGQDVRKALKIRTLILSAADIDAAVFAQTFGGERLVNAADQVVLYASSGDPALIWAKRIQRSEDRVGRIDAVDILPEAATLLLGLPQMEIVECGSLNASLGHGYLYADPAALSDLILVLRDGRRAGAEFGRPLRKSGPVWYIDAGYPVATTRAATQPLH